MGRQWATLVLRLAAILVLALVWPAALAASLRAATPVTIVASGLTNPRGFAIDAAGRIDVAIAGQGGPHAGVVTVSDGCPRPIVDGLPGYRIVFGAVLELFTALAGIGTAVAVFPVVRRQSEAASLGFVTTRSFEAAVMVIGVIALMSIVSLRQAGAASGTDDTALVAVGQALVTVRDQTALVGPGFVPALNALCFGYVLFRSRLVPRIIPTLGLIGAPLLMASAISCMFLTVKSSVSPAWMPLRSRKSSSTCPCTTLVDCPSSVWR